MGTTQRPLHVDDERGHDDAWELGDAITIRLDSDSDSAMDDCADEQAAD